MSIMRCLAVGFWFPALLVVAILAGCSGAQIDVTPSDRFEQRGYTTYSWRNQAVTNRTGDNDPLFLIDGSLRRAVESVLAEKGYQKLASGGEFTVDYQFQASIAEGAMSSSADVTNSQSPVNNRQFVINREADPALVDNAYALAGPREINSILLRFSDGRNQGQLWAATISKVVEDLNREDGSQLRKGIDTAIRRAFRRLPNAS